MLKEIVTQKEKTTDLSVTGGKISAILRSNVTKTGLRLYDNNCLAIASAIGAYDENELINSAKQLLKFKLPYDAKPEENIKRTVDLSGELKLSDEEFVEQSRKLLEQLGKKYPDFLFSHKLRMIESEQSLLNDCGTALIYKDKIIQLTLMNKHKDSKSLMDGFGIVYSRELDFDKALSSLSLGCDVYTNKIDFSEKGEKIPVIFSADSNVTLAKFVTDLRADTFNSGASLFSGKIGEKLFSEDFSLYVDRNSKEGMERFFDGEGVVLPNDKYALIEKGVLKSPYTSKRMAKQYGYDITGSASFVYDSAPDASPGGISIKRSNKTLKELVGGQKAIYITSASGGDFTPQGEYASPIQTAYLFDGEKLIGRLPQLSMRSTVFDIYGKDFIGASSDCDYPGSPINYFAANLTVNKIDGWL